MSIFVMSVAWQADLPVMEQHVLIALADHAWDDGSHVYPSVGYIAWKTNVDERTVQRNMRKLEARHILIPVSQLKGGRGKITVYRIALDAIPLKGKYGPIEEYKDEKGDSVPPFESQKGDFGDKKGDSGDKKGGNDDRKGGTVPPKPSLTISNKPSIETSPRARASFTNLKQKTENAEAERPRSMPAVELALRLPEVTPLPDPTPPIAPPPPAPPAELSFGVERFMYWQQVRTLVKPRFGAGFLSNYFDRCNLYERGDGDYVIVCPTPFVQEQIMIRARTEIVLQLAAVARSHVDLEVIVA